MLINVLSCKRLRFVLASMCCFSLLFSTGISAAEEPLDSNEAGNNSAIELAPFIAKYQLSRRGTALGEGVRTLRKLDEHQYEFSYWTFARFLVLSDERQELTKVRIIDAKVTPYWYEFEREGTGTDKTYNIAINQQSGEVKDVLKDRIFNQVLATEGFQDPISYQLQLQIDLLNGVDEWKYESFNRDGHSKTFEFEKVADETLMVPFGTFKAIKLKRVIANNNRQTYAWLAPELNYTLLRLRQVEGGEENYDVQLSDLQWVSETD
jgi:hypothetical protein